MFLFHLQYFHLSCFGLTFYFKWRTLNHLSYCHHIFTLTHALCMVIFRAPSMYWVSLKKRNTACTSAPEVSCTWVKWSGSRKASRRRLTALLVRHPLITTDVTYDVTVDDFNEGTFEVAQKVMLDVHLWRLFQYQCHKSSYFNIRISQNPLHVMFFNLLFLYMQKKKQCIIHLIFRIMWLCP